MDWDGRLDLLFNIGERERVEERFNIGYATTLKACWRDVRRRFDVILFCTLKLNNFSVQN
jgi:hypothetical protein